MHMNTSKYLIILVLSVLTGLSVHTSTAEASSGPKIPSDPAAVRSKKQDFSFAVPAESVLKRLKQGQKIILVDVRNKGEFEKVRIPGAINIPLFAVKTKAFLKSGPLVLVDTGCSNSLLEKECRTLRNAGFTVSILNGGLTSWRRKGGKLEGDLLALNRYNKISPRIFFREKENENMLVIDISGKQADDSKRLILHGIHVPVSGNLKEKLKKLRALFVNRNRFQSVLVFNETGKDYERVEKILEKAGVENVFYLKGGLNAYKRFLQHQVLSRKSKESRIKTVNKCGKCGQKIKTIHHESTKN